MVCEKYRKFLNIIIFLLRRLLYASAAVDSADAATAVAAAVAETAAEAVLQYLLGPVIESEILRPQTGVLPMSY